MSHHHPGYVYYVRQTTGEAKRTSDIFRDHADALKVYNSWVAEDAMYVRENAGAEMAVTELVGPVSADWFA